jgi:capsular exopolysaccharide synthesis family protein
MANSLPPSNFPDTSGDSVKKLVDFDRLVFFVLRYWYVLALSLILSLLVGFYLVRYSQPVYIVSASIIIREKEETTGAAELLYENALINQYRNYLNEPYILRSYPLVQRALTDENFMVSFHLEGRVISSEVYRIPIKCTFRKNDNSKPSQYYFSILSKDKFVLESIDEKMPAKKTFPFDQGIKFEGVDFLFAIESNEQLTDFIGQRFLMQLHDSLQLTSEYVAKLKVDWAVKGAGVMNISVPSSTPLKGADFILSLIRNYQQNDLEKKNLTADRTVLFIKDQLISISDSLKRFETQLQQFKKENRTTGDLSVDAQRAYSKIESLEVQNTALLIHGKYYDYLDKYLKENRNLEQVILPNSMGISDPILGSLLLKIVDIQLELKLFLKGEKSVNPLVLSKSNRLAELKNEVVTAVESLRSTDEIKSKFLKKQIELAEKQIGYLPLAQRQFIAIQRNYSLLENLYVYLMQKKSEAEISKAANVSDLIIVNPPMSSGESIALKPMQTYLICFFVGLIVPFLMFILTGALNTKIQSREDIEKHLTIPFLGGIGHKKSDINLAVFSSPKSAISEAFRSIRSNLSYFVSKQSKGVFLIASSISGEGKTFTSVNLASVFALSNKKTLLIGADMRRPKIFADFNLTNQEGLSSFLAGLIGFDQTIQKTDFDNLWIATGGPIPPNPSELIISSKMKEFLSIAKEKFDIIIIDSPPLALVSDAWELTKLVDHTIFLVRQNYTQKSLLKTIQDSYQSGKLVSISIVLNDISLNGYGYGYGYGSYGYSYYQSGKAKDTGYYSE